MLLVYDSRSEKKTKTKIKPPIYSRTAYLILEMRHDSCKALDVCCVCAKERRVVGSGDTRTTRDINMRQTILKCSNVHIFQLQMFNFFENGCVPALDILYYSCFKLSSVHSLQCKHANTFQDSKLDSKLSTTGPKEPSVGNRFLSYVYRLFPSIVHIQ